MGDRFVVSKKELIVSIRGDDDLDMRGQYRRIGEEKGWSVEERRGFDESAGKMLTRQVYSQSFDDFARGDVAANTLMIAIGEASPVARLCCPNGGS